VDINKLEARVKPLENVESVQFARTKILIQAMEQKESDSQVLSSALLLSMVLEPSKNR
jgi:hypothetical protein